MKSLPSNFKPKLVTINFTAQADNLLASVEQELKNFASKDSNKCWGYFPALSEKNKDLTWAKQFHKTLPKINLEGKSLELNFIRISLIKQSGASPFHMDSDSKTALTGDTATINSRLVWRLLLNGSTQHSRTLGYLDINTGLVELTSEEGYIHYVGETKPYEKAIVIPPRSKGSISGVLFCASRVLHTGKDDDYGHFVVGFGCEEAV